MNNDSQVITMAPSTVTVKSATVVPFHTGITPYETNMLTVSLSSIIIIALLGNSIVVAVFCTYKPLRKITNSFLVSLAFSDILVGVVSMPAWIFRIHCDTSCNLSVRKGKKIYRIPTIFTSKWYLCNIWEKYIRWFNIFYIFSAKLEGRKKMQTCKIFFWNSKLPIKLFSQNTTPISTPISLLTISFSNCKVYIFYFTLHFFMMKFSFCLYIMFIDIIFKFSLICCLFQHLDVLMCIDVLIGVASILNLTAISACRYIEITKPYTFKEIVTKRRVAGCLVLIWTFAGAMALLKGVIPRNKNIWMYQPGYQLLIFMVSFAVPLIGIFYCYMRMFKEVSRQQNQVKISPIKTCIVMDIKAIKTIAIVVFAFFICWCPFFVLVLANGFCKCVTNAKLINLVKFMHYSNSTVNPIIYVWYNKQYRQSFLAASRKFAQYHGAEIVVAFMNNQQKYKREPSKVEAKAIALLRSWCTSEMIWHYHEFLNTFNLSSSFQLL